MIDDELAKKWGAWGGDRKLSPRFPSIMDQEIARDARNTLNGYVAFAVLGVAAVFAVLWFT